MTEPQKHAGQPGPPESPVPEGASPISGTEPPASTRWKKGQSGNPGGRPKGTSVTAALRELAKSEHGGKALLVLLAERMMKEALSGKFNFAKEVIDRLDGKVPDKHQVEATGQSRVFICRPPRVIGQIDAAPHTPELTDEPGPGEPGD